MWGGTVHAKTKNLCSSSARFQGSVPRLCWGRKKLSIYSGAASSRGLRPVSPLTLGIPSCTPFGEACGRTGLRHCKSRAALPSQSLAPGPFFVSSCSQPPLNERCKVLPWLLLVRPVPGDSTLKFHCGVTIVRSKKQRTNSPFPPRLLTHVFVWDP